MHSSTSRWILPVLLLTVLLASTKVSLAEEQPFEEPLFDLHAIQNDPLHLKVLSEDIADGLIIRKIEFAGGPSTTDAPQRVQGLLVLPEHGEDLPALLWCMGGMARAHAAFPSIYARKGYACIVITLPHGDRNSFSTWDAASPESANLTRFGHMQMRAITVLCHEPRVDVARIGVAGASYGGFFSTLVAGADPRVKAGASFFTGGHHDMGTNLPQFNRMPDIRAVQTWMKTIDPAWRHERRDIPFMWTLPTNDNWFYFPAVVETFDRARTEDKVLAVVPFFTHGFPPNVDQQIFDWFDIYLTKTRQRYINPGPLKITGTARGLKATWSIEGRTVDNVQLVVSPNAPGGGESPWLGQWVHRLHQPFGATIEDDGRTASAMIPILDPTRPILVYGNVTDARGVVTSTRPRLLVPPYPADSPTGAGHWNGCPWGAMEPEDIEMLTALAQPPGAADDTNAYRGAGSCRVDALPERGKSPMVKLFHVPHLAHELTLALRSDPPAKIRVTVEALPPANWQTPAVRAVMKHQPPGLDAPTPAAETTVEANTTWQEVTVQVPAPSVAIEGYNLRLQLTEAGNTTFWYDAVEFTPVAPVHGTASDPRPSQP